jgi:hypothetical protein
MVSSCRVNGENLVSVSICLYMKHANTQKKRHCSTSSRCPLHAAALAMQHPRPCPIECTMRFFASTTQAKEHFFHAFLRSKRGTLDDGVAPNSSTRPYSRRYRCTGVTTGPANICKHGTKHHVHNTRSENKKDQPSCAMPSNSQYRPYKPRDLSNFYWLIYNSMTTAFS